MQIHELNTFTEIPGNASFLAIDDGFDTGKISINALLSDTNSKIDKKVNAPIFYGVPDYGNPGQSLRTNGDGTTEWASVGLPTDEQTEEAINAWLDEHPEATTTVQDHSLTYEKLVIGALGYVTPEMFGAKGDGVTDDTTAIQSAVQFENVFLMPNAEYLITEPISLANVNIVGFQSKIIIDESIGNYNFTDRRIFDCSGNNINIQGVNFELIVTDDTNGMVSNETAVFYSIADKFILRDCEINNEGQNASGIKLDAFWFQSGKVIIENCNIKHYPNSTSGVGGSLWFTLKSFGNINALVKNCIIDQKGRDEIIACWSASDADSDGTLDCIVDNCKIIKNYASNFLSGQVCSNYANGEVKKVKSLYKSCYFVNASQNKNNYFGCGNNVSGSDIELSMIFDNCEIEVKGTFATPIFWGNSAKIYALNCYVHGETQLNVCRVNGSGEIIVTDSTIESATNVKTIQDVGGYVRYTDCIFDAGGNVTAEAGTLNAESFVEFLNCVMKNFTATVTLDTYEYNFKMIGCEIKRGTTGFFMSADTPTKLHLMNNIFNAVNSVTQKRLIYIGNNIEWKVNNVAPTNGGQIATAYRRVFNIGESYENGIQVFH